MSIKGGKVRQWPTARRRAGQLAIRCLLVAAHPPCRGQSCWLKTRPAHGGGMNDDFIVTTFVVIDKTMAALGHRDDVRAQASDAEVLTVAVVAATYFQSHLARALAMMRLGRYLSGPLSVSRFSRRLHRLADWLGLLLEALGALFATGEAFLIDSMPVPVCRRARARRSRKASGKDFCGYCAAKREKFFG